MPRRKQRKKQNFIRNTSFALLFFAVVIGTFMVTRLYDHKAKEITQKSQESSARVALHKAAGKIATTCKSPYTREDCYSKEFKELTKKTDMKFAQQTLAILQDIDPLHARGCHLIAHYIALAETEKNPEKWKELLTQTDSNSCTGGYVHGILEAHTASEPNFKVTAANIPTICSLLPDANAGGDVNCSHNLGHILLAQEQNSIPNGVTICNDVVGDRVKYECLSGVFMERMTRLNLESHGIAKRIPWNKKNTEEMEMICHAQTGVALTTCWREISHMFATLNRDEPVLVFEACNRAEAPAASRDCYLHAASIMAVSSNFNPENLTDICTVYDEQNELFGDCIGHVIGGMLLSSDKFSDRVIKLCNETSSTYKKTCFQKMGTSLRGVVRSDEKRQAICSQAPKEYQSLCLGGTNL